MADYIPKFKPGEDLTMTAGAAIVGGRLVYVSGANTVQETAGITAAWLGVADQDAASGAKVGITSGGVQELTASGTIAAGDTLVAAAAGQVATLAAAAATGTATATTQTDITNSRAIVGIALTAATNGNKVLVRMTR
ncbi:MAG: DUF2190 family protein [Nocardioidaceae bacterium]|nr:DUF2190 family protein [Nocardioidaceae bacterium]